MDDEKKKPAGKKRANFKKKAQIETLAASPLTLENGAGQLIATFSPRLVSRYRQFHTRISVGKIPRRMGIAGTLHEEGCTTVALGLATVMARDLDVRICLVETNWWWPGLASLAKLEPDPGLAQVVAGKADLKDALRPTGDSKLWLLPAGSSEPSERARFARSQGLPQVLEQLDAQFDHLILDLPPLLSTDDAAPVAAYAEAIYLVIRQGVTPLLSIRQGLDSIEHLPVRGVVLNGDKTAIPKWLLKLIPGG
jgi:polysaccharide biosynthesis transport protein